VRHPAYTSTTTERDDAEAYVGAEADRGFAARIHVPAGTPAIAIRDEEDGFDNEGELVLPRGLEYRVVADAGPTGDYGIRWLDLEILAGPDGVDSRIQ
jgi:hypothetical protein